MIGLAAAGAACGKGDGTSESAPPVGPTAVYAAFTDDVRDLLTGSPIASGRLVVPGRPSIEIRDGHYTVSESHQLQVGAVHSSVLIEASGCVPRKTSVVVQADGLRVDLGYKRAPLDLVSDEGLYEQWLETRQGRILERWDPALYRGAILYDRELFRYDGTKPVLYATDYDTQPSFVRSVEEIAGAEIAAMTGGALRDGLRLASQLPRSEWSMVPDARGWLLFYTLLGYFDWQSFSILSAPFTDGFGTVHASILSLPPGRPTTPGEIRAKTREAIGAYRSGSVPAASVGEAFGTIQYHRKIGHRVGDVPDYQD